jgi:hypothetical protein
MLPMFIRAIHARVLASALSLFAAGAVAVGQTPELPPKERFHLFLLIGQSNMAGRGVVAATDTIPHARVLALNKAGE